MSRYAEDTQVPSDRSRAEIESTLRRYGATEFAYGWQGTRAMIGFRMEGRYIKFILPMPDPDDESIRKTPTGRLRSAPQRERHYEQSQRQRWRALCLVIKAKLEAVETGITEFEEEFLAHIVLPGGQTVGDFMRPQIDDAYTTGSVPKMLPDLSNR